MYMENNVQNQPEFDRSIAHIGVKYNFIIYPIDFAVLNKVLSSQGYSVVRPTGAQDLVAGGILEVEGTVARKDDLAVESFADKQVLGVNSKDAEKLLFAFGQLEEALSKELGI